MRIKHSAHVENMSACQFRSQVLGDRVPLFDRMTPQWPERFRTDAGERQFALTAHIAFDKHRQPGRITLLVETEGSQPLLLSEVLPVELQPFERLTERGLRCLVEQLAPQRLQLGQRGEVVDLQHAGFGCEFILRAHIRRVQTVAGSQAEFIECEKCGGHFAIYLEELKPEAQAKPSSGITASLALQA